MTWKEAMNRFGSDKPDMRFGMELKDVSDVVRDCGFGVFTGALENGGSVRGIQRQGTGRHAPESRLTGWWITPKISAPKAWRICRSTRMEPTRRPSPNS